MRPAIVLLSMPIVCAAWHDPVHALKAGQSLEALARIAGAVSDTECARRMQEAKRQLFGKIEPERRSA